MHTNEKMGFRPYVSIDIETTGLDRKRSEILEIAAVFDDGVIGKPISQMPTFQCLIKQNSFEYAEPYALQMNKSYFDEFVLKTQGQSKANWLTPTQAVTQLTKFLMDAHSRAIATHDVVLGWDRPMSNIEISGKNFGSYDHQVLESFFLRLAPTHWPALSKIMGYKFLDVGPMFHADFGFLPGLDAINELTGRNQVSHRAYDDAVDVIFANRYNWCRARGINFKETTIA